MFTDPFKASSNTVIHSKLPQILWVETLMTTCYLVNRSPSSALNFKTPVEMWSGRAVNYSNLKIFVVQHMHMSSKES